MVIHRIVRSAYRDDRSGQGAFLYGGRWNSKGQSALYAADHISLAVLEMIVNYDRSVSRLQPSYHLIEMEVPESLVIEISPASLKKSWNLDRAYTRYIGDAFLQSRGQPVLKIPSAVIPEENNFLINPLHPDFYKIKDLTVRPYDLDKRLF